MKAGNILGLFGLVGLVGAVMFGTTACPPVIEPDGGTDAGVDAGVDAGFPQPAGTTALNFTIDATGRPAFYANEDLEWKGSFSYDKTTRILTYNSSWAGPYAGLWDDGAWTSGGHEPKGSTAGDNKFGITAFINTPTTDTTIEYGAQTKAGGWLWQGANGTVLVPANSTAEITAAGLTLPPEGTVDLKLMIDTTNLGSGFSHAAGTPITVKGQMSDWGEDTAFDDGTHGDATSGDGLYTYTLSANAIRRLKLTSGTYVEFIWVFHPTLADGGVGSSEYKKPNGDAENQGVSAQTNKAGAGWNTAAITYATNKNTQVGPLP